MALCCALLPLSPTAKTLEVPFEDVPETAWYYSAVEHVYNHGIMAGTSENLFRPGTSMSRAMFVTVIYRHSGEKNTAVNAFLDVPANSWYTQAVAWAAAKGIVAGVDAQHFDPLSAITREQMTCMLYRYAAVYGFNTSGTANLMPFTDRDSVSDYAVEAIKWALAQRIMNGTSKSTLSPQKTATRAEAAYILSQFCIRNQYTGYGITGDEKTVTLDGQQVSIGMQEQDIILLFGQPAEILQSVHGFTWMVYNITDYQNFFAIGVRDKIVMAIYAEGRGFSYMGYKGFTKFPEGSSAPRTFANGTGAQMDKVDGNCMYAVYLKNDESRYEGATAKALKDEAKFKYHLINTYRASQNLSPLNWEEKTAAMAQGHSQNMCDNGFVNHTTPDGMTLVDRLDMEEIPWRYCGENIVVGTLDAPQAHNRLLNSQGHRGNILSKKFTNIGVGTAFTANVYYVFYFTEDFWG